MWLKHLKQRLTRTSERLTGGLGGLLGDGGADGGARFFDELETRLLGADVGAATSLAVIDNLKKRAGRGGARDLAALLELFGWDERQFRRKLAGSPIRRIGHERWQRNIAVALGNNDYSPDIAAALDKKRDDPSPLVREHVRWALQEMERKRRAPGAPGAKRGD